VGLARGPLRFVITFKELLERKSSGSSLEIRQYGRRNVTLTMWHPLSANVCTNFADKTRSLGRYSSFADSGHEVLLCIGIPVQKICIPLQNKYELRMLIVQHVKSYDICYILESSYDSFMKLLRQYHLPSRMLYVVKA
jgi:hypothetical protein